MRVRKSFKKGRLYVRLNKCSITVIVIPSTPLLGLSTVSTCQQFHILLQGGVECHQHSSFCFSSKVNIVAETENVSSEMSSAAV